ncbi:class I SAM-dependent methyltransferase [Microbacterium insulae]|uniref:Class I SAM-dependent methyltransferase n=1 Tax=Microbacterium insulae TaxID=483014 RepID=A0ABW3AK65_9MICO
MTTHVHDGVDTAEAELRAAEADEGAALTMRLLASLTPALELLTVELGLRHGIYASIDQAGAVTSAELSAQTGITERQLREWLDQQAIAGILLADSGEPRRYRLPGAFRPVLLDPTSPLHGAGLAEMFAGIAETFDDVAATFPHGGAVRYADFGPAVRHGLETIYRPGYTHALPLWMEALPDITARLEAGGTILDAGCGTGWSSVALAQRFPRARVIGVDLDEASIDEARRHAAASGVGDRVSFACLDATDAGAISRVVDGEVALVTVFLALHDMRDPRRGLAALSSTLEPGGAILIGDAQVSDEFVAPGTDTDRMFSAFSVLHCLPATLAEGGGHAHGTVLRAPSVIAWGRDVGLAHARQLPIEHPAWSFYRLNA